MEAQHSHQPALVRQQQGMEVPTLDYFGYNVTSNYVGSGKTGSLIASEMDALRQVLVSGSPPSSSTGHIWVVDGIYTYERWYYYWSSILGTGYAPTDLYRYRAQGRLYHCNWGWGGLSNGWYYSYNPKQAPSYTNTGEYHYLFDTDKRVCTGIFPK